MTVIGGLWKQASEEAVETGAFDDASTGTTMLAKLRGHGQSDPRRSVD